MVGGVILSVTREEVRVEKLSVTGGEDGVEEIYYLNESRLALLINMLHLCLYTRAASLE